MSVTDFFKGWKLNLLGVVMVIIASLDLAQNSNLVPDEWKPVILFAAGVLTIVLRTFYTDGVAAIRKMFK